MVVRERLKKCGKFMTMEFLATLAVALLHKMQWENAKRTAYKVFESAAVFLYMYEYNVFVVMVVRW